MPAAPDNESLASVLARSQPLVDAIRADLARASTDDADGDRLRWAVDRLAQSVVRPLESATGALSADVLGSVGSVDRSKLVGSVLWQLALDVTKLSCEAGASGAIKEAAGGLQDLACQLAGAEGDEGLPSRLRALSVIQAHEPAGIQTALAARRIPSAYPTAWIGTRGYSSPCSTTVAGVPIPDSVRIACRLFLEKAVDRQSMLFVFDLWKYEDVVTHAKGILGRLEQGTMPCDGAWPAERVEVFRRWVDGGTPR